MTELNPFLQGRRFKLEQEARQLDLDAGRRREKGINALADMFGPTFNAPVEAVSVRREERIRKTGVLEQERLTTVREEERQEFEQERGLTAARSTVAFLKSGIANNVPFEELASKAGTALVALGLAEEDVNQVLQAVSADPSLLDQFEAAIVAQQKQTTGRFGRITPAVDAKGNRVLIRGTPGGGFQTLKNVAPDVALAERRADTAARGATVKEAKINPNLAFFVKGAEKAGAVTGERLNTGLTEARASQLTVEATQRLDELIDKGIKTGSLAEARLGTLRFFQTFLGLEDEEIENTDEFRATQGRAVAEVIKAFGAGTGLSDADREFASQIVGQELSMSEAAIRRLVGIVRKRALRTVKDYNRDRDVFVKNVPALEEIFPRVGDAGKVFVRDPVTGDLVPK